MHVVNKNVNMHLLHREKYRVIYNTFKCATSNTTHLSVPFLYAI